MQHVISPIALQQNATCDHPNNAAPEWNMQWAQQRCNRMERVEPNNVATGLNVLSLITLHQNGTCSEPNNDAPEWNMKWAQQRCTRMEHVITPIVLYHWKLRCAKYTRRMWLTLHATLWRFSPVCLVWDYCLNRGLVHKQRTPNLVPKPSRSHRYGHTRSN